MRHETRTGSLFGSVLLELETNGLDAHPSSGAAIATDEMIADAVGSGAAPATLRIWENGRALVVPRSCLRERRGEVVDRFDRAWPIYPRRSGGAVVAHGPGTLHMSVVVPLRGRLQPSIEASYRLWIGVLDTTLRRAYDIAVDGAAVEGAFCGGRFDAVAGGRKLAGVAQARSTGSVLVHGTILVNVDRKEYLRVIEAAERFLGISNADRYDPERVVSLHELAGREVTNLELARAIVRTAPTERGR
jgi:lipoate-protein ligase A